MNHSLYTISDGEQITDTIKSYSLRDRANNGDTVFVGKVGLARIRVQNSPVMGECCPHY